MTPTLLKRPQYLETPESKVSPSSKWPKYELKSLKIRDRYLQLPKDSIVAAVHTPSFETLHSLILLSWAEYGGGRENGLNIFSAVSNKALFSWGRKTNLISLVGGANGFRLAPWI